MAKNRRFSDKAQDELKNGAVFETLIAKYSDCPDNSGDLGYITKGQMAEEFESVVFNLGVTEVSDVFRTRFGFHIARLYDRKPAVIPALEEVKEQVVGELKEQMRNKAIDEFVDRLKSKAKITSFAWMSCRIRNAQSWYKTPKPKWHWCWPYLMFRSSLSGYYKKQKCTLNLPLWLFCIILYLRSGK